MIICEFFVSVLSVTFKHFLLFFVLSRSFGTNVWVVESGVLDIRDEEEEVGGRAGFIGPGSYWALCSGLWCRGDGVRIQRQRWGGWEPRRWAGVEVITGLQPHWSEPVQMDGSDIMRWILYSSLRHLCSVQQQSMKQNGNQKDNLKLWKWNVIKFKSRCYNNHIQPSKPSPLYKDLLIKRSRFEYDNPDYKRGLELWSLTLSSSLIFNPM